MGSAPPDQCDLAFDCTGSPPVDAGPADAAACTMDKCQNQAIACMTGEATNLRCVPDPNAGVGSDPVGHCLLMGDCPPSAQDASAD
jgi:hypothetical protein